MNVGSVYGRATAPEFGLYSAMKVGVGGLSPSIAVQYGVHRIRANTTSPGLVDGQQVRDVVANFMDDVEGWAQNFSHTGQALPKMIQSEDIGRIAVFLASNDPRSITGIDIPVDARALAQLSSRSSE